MNIAEFTQLTDLHGADFSRWPVEKIKPALALKESDAKARAHFEDALALDALLRHGDSPVADLSALEARISAAIAEAVTVPMPRVSRPVFFVRPFAMIAPCFALVLALFSGFIVGAKPAQSDILASALAAPDIVMAAEEAMIAEEGDF